MESDMTSSSPLPSPDIPDNYDPPPTGVFTITREDSKTLLEYIEEFQDGDSDMRSKIVANAMAALDEVMTEAEEMSGALPGSWAFLGSLQDVTTKLWKELSDNEQQLYVRLANKWSDEPPPANIQARMASSLFKSCGICCIVLAAHEKEDKTIVTGLYETDKPNNTQELFLSFCSDWSSAPLFKEWKRYAKQCYGRDDILTVLKSCCTTRRTPIPISVRADGCPEIPNITEANEYKTKTVQAMLRSYLITHIKCTPDGFTWADPSKICIGDIHLILEHWRERKRQCLNPLIWMQPYHQRSAKTALLMDLLMSALLKVRDVKTGQMYLTHFKAPIARVLPPSQKSRATFGMMGGLGDDSHMGSLPLHRIYSAQEGSGSLQDDRTPAEFNALSDSDRGRPAASPSECELQLNDEGEGDASLHHPESNQSLSDESVKMLEVPKCPIKLTEKAKFMDAGGGKGKLTTGIFQRCIYQYNELDILCIPITCVGPCSQLLLKYIDILVVLVPD
ncbi:hypothetical protein V8E53_007145 [Lactarius tabidus]